MKKMKYLLALTLFSSSLFAKENVEITWGGAGWTQFQYIVESSDTAQSTLNGNYLMSGGGLITSLAKIGDRWEGSAGVGVLESHIPRGGKELSQDPNFQLSTNALITEASFTYKGAGTPEKPFFAIKGGKFHYNYNSRARNFGMYLIRGPVYPGYLTSGFETVEVIGVGNKRGLMFQLLGIDNLKLDVLLSAETSIRPIMDFSLTSVLQYKVGDFLELGAGVEFHRLIESTPCATSPKELSSCLNAEIDTVNFPGGGALDSTVQTPNGDSTVVYTRSFEDADRLYIYIDQAGDTTFYSLAGTKVMFQAALDFKPLLFPDYTGSKNDMVVYMEGAILGTKNYKFFYEEITERMPIMFGVSFPTFGLLDELSLEMEYYNFPYKNDRYKLENSISPIPTPNQFQERNTTTPYDPDKDNIKWSLYASKVFHNHIKFSGQVASDHWSTGGVPGTATYEEEFTKITDWYWAAKLAYFF